MDIDAAIVLSHIAKVDYQEYGLNIKKNIDNIKQKIQIIEEKPKILFIRSGASSSSCKAKNKQTNFVCEMLDELGVINIADTTTIIAKIVPIFTF
jgi:ABC-type Fe3+-hydroxamate transport system substrate-binding protein